MNNAYITIAQNTSIIYIYHHIKYAYMYVTSSVLSALFNVLELRNIRIYNTTRDILREMVCWGELVSGASWYIGATLMWGDLVRASWYFGASWYVGASLKWGDLVGASWHVGRLDCKAHAK